MIQITDKSQCCGCTACASICGHDAITMQPDDMGFLYPVVDKEKCVECGLCEKVCAFNDNYDTSLNLLQPDAYAARHKDMHEVETSRSGAAFIAISDYILENGYPDYNHSTGHAIGEEAHSPGTLLGLKENKLSNLIVQETGVYTIEPRIAIPNGGSIEEMVYVSKDGGIPVSRRQKELYLLK